MPRVFQRQLAPLGLVVDTWRRSQPVIISLRKCWDRIANDLDVTPKSVENWCFGVHPPKSATYERLATYLGYKTVQDLDNACAVHPPLQRAAADRIQPMKTARGSDADPEIDKDVIFVISPESILKPLEETLRKTVLDLAYFRLYHDLIVEFELDNGGFIRMTFFSKYAVQNRADHSINYSVSTGIWCVRGKAIDSHSAITRVACSCPNLPSDPQLNFELTRRADIATHQSDIRQARRYARPIIFPAKEIFLAWRGERRLTTKDAREAGHG
jgi:hypothetical protein